MMMMRDRRQKVLAQLEGGARTWDELRALTKVSDESLGLAIGELLDLRQIWTGRSGDVRVYGIERRTGLEELALRSAGLYQPSEINGLADTLK